MSLLEVHDIHERLVFLPSWEYTSDSIAKSYVAASFHRAIAFVVQIAILAELADHHPDIDIRYNRVTITLSTHSAGGVTEKDFALAKRIEEAFA